VTVTDALDTFERLPAAARLLRSARPVLDVADVG
jgi:hypothetical protein